MDEVTFVKTKFLMEQWEKLIIDRQNSGLQVDEWCKKSNKSSCLLLLAPQDSKESM